MVFLAEIRMFWAVVASTMAGVKCQDLKSKRALPLDNFFHEPVKCLCPTLSLASRGSSCSRALGECAELASRMLGNLK